MENQNLNPSAPAADQKKDQNGGGQGHRNNRRHHHKNRHHDRGNAEKNAARRPAEATAEALPSTDEPREQKKNSPGKDGQKPRDNKQDKKRGNDRGRGNRGGRGNRNDRNRSGEKRPYNPYEEPVAEELSLAELRARIVVKPVDEPAAEAEPVSPVETVTEAPAEEAVTLTSPDTAEEITVDPTEPTAEEDPVERVEVIGIRFRSSGKMYYFDPHGICAKKGDHAIVETARGPEFGDVCLGNTMIRQTDVVAPLRPILRLATPADIAHNAENREKEQGALKICQEKILAHKLEMKLVDVQYAFDNSKLLFYFTADGRVDFRELVKDLASVFRTRIELRQIGIRDEAKLLGGLGACGRTLCCSTFLPDFAQVSIKMAKEQNLSLNSSKISGVCGRLMCCLRFEADVYAEEIRKTPSVESTVMTEDGVGTVISTNPLAGTIRVILKNSPDTPPKQYHRNEVRVMEREKRSNGGAPKGSPVEKTEIPEANDAVTPAEAEE